jgi:hypothetical protein
MLKSEVRGQRPEIRGRKSGALNTERSTLRFEREIRGKQTSSRFAFRVFGAFGGVSLFQVTGDPH